MNNKKLFSGNLQEDDFLKVLFRLHSEKLTGTLIIEKSAESFNIFLKNGIIIFANSNSKTNRLGEFLLGKKIISETDFNNTTKYSQENEKRFGRSLLELKIIDNDCLWENVQEHLKSLIFSFFADNTGKYSFFTDTRLPEENITLDINILQLMVKGSRIRIGEKFIEEKLAATVDVYPLSYLNLDELNLKPYEIHILKLIKKDQIVKSIINNSELLRFDTLKLIDLFLTMKIITNNKELGTEGDLKKAKKQKKFVNENEKISGATSFVSFAEALKFYNNKYELIYKVFSKEIGPIALSILQKSITDISENLPIYLQKIKWNGNGTIQEESLLKSVYHKDFQENIKEFLTGLEEILYAGIYTIRKNISPEKEQTILKWINRPVK